MIFFFFFLFFSNWTLGGALKALTNRIELKRIYTDRSQGSSIRVVPYGSQRPKKMCFHAGSKMEEKQNSGEYRQMKRKAISRVMICGAK